MISIHVSNVMITVDNHHTKGQPEGPDYSVAYWVPNDITHERNDDQFRPPIALRTDLSHITTALWEIPVLRMAH